MDSDCHSGFERTVLFDPRGTWLRISQYSSDLSFHMHGLKFDILSCLVLGKITRSGTGEHGVRSTYIKYTRPGIPATTSNIPSGSGDSFPRLAFPRP